MTIKMFIAGIVGGVLFWVGVTVGQNELHAQVRSRQVFIDPVDGRHEITPTGSTFVGASCGPSGCYVFSTN